MYSPRSRSSADSDSVLEKSPGIATVISARSPASFTSTVAAPKNSSSFSAAISWLMPLCTSLAVTSGESITTSAVSTPSENSSFTTSNA